MTPELRRFVVIQLTLVPALMNAAIAWWQGTTLVNVPAFVSGNGSRVLATDLMVTAILLPALTCVIASFLLRRALKVGAVERIAHRPGVIGLLASILPKGLGSRAVSLGIINGALCAYPVFCLASWLSGMNGDVIVSVKVMLTVLLSMIYTPLIGILVLSESGE